MLTSAQEPKGLARAGSRGLPPGPGQLGDGGSSLWTGPGWRLELVALAFPGIRTVPRGDSLLWGICRKPSSESWSPMPGGWLQSVGLIPLLA